MTIDTTAYGRDQLIARARRLAPTLRERAAATSAAGRVPAETIGDFWDADLFYLLKPKKFGGPELRPDLAFSVAGELARGDGSAAGVGGSPGHHLYV